jgi:hypothetical protein
MSNVTAIVDFQHLDSMSQTALFERRTALVGLAPNGDYKHLPDEVLMELVAIHRVLRRKVSPATKPSVTRKGANMVPTLDNI